MIARPLTKLLSAWSLVLLLTSQGTSQEPNLGVFAAGERLQYKVKWLFFRVGTIVVTTDSVSGRPGLYRVSIALDSNPDFFFINIHHRYQGIVNSRPVRCEEFLAREQKGDDTLVTSYRLVPRLRQVVMEQRLLPADTLIKRLVKDSISLFFDGSSLMFFARTMIHTETHFSAPTMVDLDLFATELTFTNKTVPLSIGAQDEEIDTKELFGQANFEGKTFGGFSGEFKGWFSNDYASIPIRAEMSITVGTVDVELEQWDRAGWYPPKAQEEK